MALNDPAQSSNQHFDAVALQRAIREQIRRETEGLTFDELQRYLHMLVATGPRTPAQVAEPGRGPRS